MPNTVGEWDLGSPISIHTHQFSLFGNAGFEVVNVSFYPKCTLYHLHLGLNVLDQLNSIVCLLCNKETLDACASERDTELGSYMFI